VLEKPPSKTENEKCEDKGEASSDLEVDPNDTGTSEKPCPQPGSAAVPERANRVENCEGNDSGCDSGKKLGARQQVSEGRNRAFHGSGS
jgi:hypothetical protein